MTVLDHPLSHLSEVLTLFLIPIGGGIPAGVILAKKYNLEWTLTTLLYFISDVILAILFEPLMLIFMRLAKHSPFLQRWLAAYKMTMAKTGFKHGLTPGPFALIVLSFGVDPMTGRAAARAAGHGFVSGWTLAIIGDMFFFGLIMASTLWLNNLLGDGTMAALIVMGAMIVIPMLIDKWKASRMSKKT